MVEWKALPWRKLEKRVFKLQKRIYKAEQRGDVRAVRKLQKLLMRSWSAKCLGSLYRLHVNFVATVTDAKISEAESASERLCAAKGEYYVARAYGNRPRMFREYPDSV
ncbi:MAG: reverse transcriptase N-terminal domain-containing protein, partial [Gemmatimonadaceae bacterium]|nr:reverse transcriptase N-terminal domain-containing protein [Gloeobacterales cyanobacterium ES-bin-141]